VDPDSSPLRRGSVSNCIAHCVFLIEVCQSNKLGDVNIATNPNALNHFWSIFSKIAILMGHKLSTERLIKCAAAVLLTFTNSFPSDKHTTQSRWPQTACHFLLCPSNQYRNVPTKPNSTDVYQSSHMPHNDVSVKEGPHIRRWSHKNIILYYNVIILYCTTLYGVHITTKSPNDAFLRTYTRR